MGRCQGRRKNSCNQSVCSVVNFVASLIIPAEDPATAEELGHIPEMGLVETKEAIDAASKAFQTWKKTTPKASAASVRVS